MQKKDFRILVVDDEPDWVTTNRKVLSRAGFTVTGAGDAAEALKLAGAQKFHLAFLDINMPGMEGIELVDHLRTACPDIAVIMLTGYGTEDKNAAARQKGVMDFLEKIGPSGDRMLGEEMVELAEEGFEKLE